MRLLNYTTSYFAIILLIVISLWAVVFYYVMLNEIYDSMDDGLENQKMLVLEAVKEDTSLLSLNTFENRYYLFQEIDQLKALERKEQYFDTLLYMQNEDDYEPVRALSSVLRVKDKYYKMLIITSMVEEDDLIASLLYSLIALYLGLITIILLINNILLKKIWAPFYDLLKRVRKFRIDKSRFIPPKESKIDEFRMLNEAIEKLVTSNIKIYQSQKQFVENAAHELQTPLAIALNKLEMVMNNKDLTKEQFSALSVAVKNLQRLIQLNKSLLLLSKIENELFDGKEKVEINVLIKKIIDDFSDLLVFKNIKLNLKEESTIIRELNPELGRVLFTNLIKNAIIHNKSGGTIDIILQPNLLRIENSGTQSLDSNSVFNRFYKESQSNENTGLGLSISKAIADHYAYKLSYVYSKQHIFQVKFN